MVQAVGKMLELYKERKLDLFKDSVSLAGITRKYVFKNLPAGVYFTRFGEEHKHIYNDLRQFGMTGGASVVFCRYHEVDKTYIKGKNLCKSIVGYDCNSMYLHCTGMKMPTSYYTLREKDSNYEIQTPYSKESLQWLDYVAKEMNVKIRHAENNPNGEKRIGNYRVDGFCEESKSVFEYYGCYHHGHCGKHYDEEKWNKTMEREEELRKLGFQIFTTTSCKWQQNPASKVPYKGLPVICSYLDIIEGIKKDDIFGFVKLDIHVPDDLKPKFDEFPVIFKNVEIPLEVVGNYMQEVCALNNRTTGVKRSLISSFFGKEIVISTELLKKYLQMGLVVTDIQWLLEYTPRTCFDWFRDEVIYHRRKADLDEIVRF